MSLYTKLLAIQTDIQPVLKSDNNPFFKSQYFDVNTVIAALRPILNKNGVVTLQPLAELNGKPAIRTLVIDAETGETIDSITPLIEMTDPQKFGGIITYTRRYALTSMFLIQGEEDDDANKASTGTTAAQGTAQATKTQPRPAQSPTSDVKCNKCGADMAISKSTGKSYCRDLCWKTPEQKAQPMPKFDPKESAKEDNYEDMGFETF